MDSAVRSSKPERQMQAFQVAKAQAPAEWAWLEVKGWVELTDEDGNKAIGALRDKNQIIIPHGGAFDGYRIGFNDCEQTIKAAWGLFA
jgi:hypothetical protein